MKIEYYTHYSHNLNREMHILAHGHGGVPILAIPCQDGMANNWESFNMHETLADYIESGAITIFSIDTIDTESFSDLNGDNGHRAWMQELYFRYVTEEAIPWIREINGTGIAPIAAGFSLGASHAAILFFRRPDLFSGMLACSGAYDTQSIWNGYMDENIYNNSPVHFLANMPHDHWYINEYNQKKIVICAGLGRWDEEGVATSLRLKEIFDQKGIHAWVDIWGTDCDHDWPWWRKQIRYFMPYLLG